MGKIHRIQTPRAQHREEDMEMGYPHLSQQRMAMDLTMDLRPMAMVVTQTLDLHLLMDLVMDQVMAQHMDLVQRLPPMPKKASCEERWATVESPLECVVCKCGLDQILLHLQPKITREFDFLFFFSRRFTCAITPSSIRAPPYLIPTPEPHVLLLLT
jgi:hypothetical protein